MKAVGKNGFGLGRGGFHRLCSATLFFSQHTRHQMCGGSRVAAMYSKSPSEGSSSCGVGALRCRQPQPLESKRKFVLQRSHEAPGGRGGFRGGYLRE